MSEHVDTIIIGSGVAAAAIAEKLLEANPKASILMLEAGTRVKTKDYGLWQHYVMTGRLPYEGARDLDYPQRDAPGENSSIGRTGIPLLGARLHVYGGSTMHWGGWAFRLKPEDFRRKSLTGAGLDWAISYDEIEDYYCQAEDYLAVSGNSADQTTRRSKPYPFVEFPFTLQDEPIAKACTSLGFSYGNLPIARRGTSGPPSRHAPCQTTGTCKYCPFGARYVASNYIDDMREWHDHSNFEVRLGCAVQRINTSSATKVSSVTYIDACDLSEHMIEAERIIVAAGTIESAKLLLRSTSADWPTGLGNKSDWVGRNFITHPYFIFTGTLPANPNLLQPETNFPTFVSRHFDSEAEQKDGKFIFVNPPDTVPTNLPGLLQAGFNHEEVSAYLKGKSKLQLHGMVEVFGEHDNRVTNLGHKNRFGLFETQVDYSAPAEFLERMAYIKAKAEMLYGAMEALLTDDGNVSWRADHAASTCRMSENDDDGVVDKDLKVHGLENLWVCSNAVFPNIGSVNPTLTLTALALRLGKQLAQGTAQ
jgi:choline dehydrogenase-like flavoprotein